MQTIPQIPDVRRRQSLRVPTLPMPLAGTVAQGGRGVMDAREFCQLTVTRRRIRASRRNIWGIGVVMVLLVMVEIWAVGRYIWW